MFHIVFVLNIHHLFKYVSSLLQILYAVWLIWNILIKLFPLLESTTTEVL